MLDTTLKTWIDAIDPSDAEEFIRALASAKGLAVVVVGTGAIESELDLERYLTPDEWATLSESDVWEQGLGRWVDPGPFIRAAVCSADLEIDDRLV